VHHHATHLHKVVHRESGVGVVIDQARLISFPQPVKTVFVGNPTIVDITMVDSQHAFVLGKTFGLTNMIALDSNGKQISDQQVVVYNNAAAVTVNRGQDQFDYMCTNAHCEASPRPGDITTFVSTTEGAASQHESSAVSAATSAPAGQTASNQ
jgi:Flp pilus assembly secretin CpaC